MSTDVLYILKGIGIILGAGLVYTVFSMYWMVREAKKDAEISKADRVRLQAEMTALAVTLNIHQQAHVRREEFDQLAENVRDIDNSLGQMRGEMRLLTREVQSVTSWLIAKQRPLSPDEDSNRK